MNQALETALDFILAGGPVMFPLMAVSIWLWTLIILKLSWVLRIKRDNTDINTARFCLSSGEKPPTNGGPRGRALKHFLTLRTGDQKADLLLWEVFSNRESQVQLFPFSKNNRYHGSLRGQRSVCLIIVLETLASPCPQRVHTKGLTLHLDRDGHCFVSGCFLYIMYCYY